LAVALASSSAKPVWLAKATRTGSPAPLRQGGGRAARGAAAQGLAPAMAAEQP
jgi:hypothetical protein